MFNNYQFFYRISIYYKSVKIAYFLGFFASNYLYSHFNICRIIINNIKGGDNLNRKILLFTILIVFISINVVSASDNSTDSPSISDVVLNTSDADLLGEDLVYNATLSDNNNAPLANQTLIFSVNGINYTRNTNLDGIAFLNIHLNDGIYDISTIFKDVNGSELINTNTIYVSHSEGTLIKDNLSGAEIQKIIDNAKEGDSLIFAGSTYSDVSVVVNKPLNIISIVKSVLKGNSNAPVIKVNSNNVNISNFVISSGSEGIYLDNADNSIISYNEIINNRNGIDVLNSKNVSIVYNVISNSRNNGVYLKNSADTNISANTFTNNYEGIYFDSDVVGTQIVSNYMSKSGNNAVNFAKSGSHTNMSYNVLEYNNNGIFFDMVGDEDINVEFNSIQRNYENGIYFGEHYRKSDEDGLLGIGNNSIVYNEGFNILARDSSYLNIKIKENYIASDNPSFNGVCEKIKFSKFHLSVSQVNGNTLFVSVQGIKTDTILRVSYNGGKNWKTVSLVNGQATLNIANDDGNVVLDYYEQDTYYQYQLENYIPPEKPVTPTNPEQTEPTNSSDNSGEGNGNNPGQGEQVEGNGTASNPDSGSSQPQSNVANSNNAIEDVSSQSVESSSSQAASQPVSSDSSAQSSSQQQDKPKSVVKSLMIDEEVVRIAGLSFIILLIIAVIGLYYRDDVQYMLNKRNGR